MTRSAQNVSASKLSQEGRQASRLLVAGGNSTHAGRSAPEGDLLSGRTEGREIRLRRITESTAEQKSLLRQLGIDLPEHLQFHRECSVDSAIA